MIDPKRHDTNEPVAIGIDIGGTKVALGVVSNSGMIIDRIVMATPKADRTSQALCDLLTDQTTRLLERNHGVVGVGVGAAGLVEWPRGIIRWAPNNSYRNL